MAARFGNAVSHGRRVTGPDAPLYQEAPIAKGLRGKDEKSRMKRRSLGVAIAGGSSVPLGFGATRGTAALAAGGLLAGAGIMRAQRPDRVGKGIAMSQLKNGAKAAGFNAQVGAALAAPKVKAGMKAATATPKRKMAVAGAAGLAGGAAMSGGGQTQQPIYVAPYSQPFGKAYRTYDPEHRRQRRMGNAEAGLTLAGGYAGHRGVRGIQRETRELRDAKIQDRPTKPMTSVERKFGRKAIAVSRRNGLLVAGGAAALAGAGGIAHHANSNRGRTYR